MSNTHSIFIGPYIKINKFPVITKTSTTQIVTCSNTNCIKHNKVALGKFCLECGSSVTNINKTTSSDIEISHWDLLEEFGDVNHFFLANEDVLIDNHSSDEMKGCYRHVDRYSEVFDEELTISREECIDRFEKHQDKFISFLRDKGVDLSVRYGIVSYYS